MDCVGVWTSGDLVVEATGKLQVRHTRLLGRADGGLLVGPC